MATGRISEQFFERIPLSYLIFSFVSGLMLLYLSPVGLFLPKWLGNPVPENVNDMPVVLLSVVLVSIAVGSMVYLLKELIAGNDGFYVPRHYLSMNTEWRKYLPQ
jgi:hypothetical protein